uniref:Uncharacterized protein n=1 Tax=Xenopus tropicalis TaxID=8364 RepID=A0A803K3D1_XENTR
MSQLCPTHWAWHHNRQEHHSIAIRWFSRPEEECLIYNPYDYLSLCRQCASAVTGFYIENSRTSLPTKSRGDFVLPSEADAYFHLLKDYVINDFLKKDSCRKIADKYLLAMVLIYFKRAHLKPCEYGRLNFFRALYLAHDMGEDPDNAKLNILLFRRRKTLVNFLQLLPKAHGNILILQAGAVTGWTRHGQDGAGVDQTGTGRSGRRPDGNRTEQAKNRNKTRAEKRRNKTKEPEQETNARGRPRTSRSWDQTSAEPYKATVVTWLYMCSLKI